MQDEDLRDDQAVGPTAGRPPLVFLELGEGRLDDAAIEALEAWLITRGPASPPEFVVARARDIGRRRRAPSADGAAAPLRRLLASLVYDTRGQALPSGVRAVTRRVRSLLFTAEEFEILLQVSPEASPERLRVMGQVLLEGSPVAAAAVRLDGPPVGVDGVTDGEGEFRLVDVPARRYSMEVATAEELIECASLDLAD